MLWFMLKCCAIWRKFLIFFLHFFRKQPGEPLGSFSAIATTSGSSDHSIGREILNYLFSRFIYFIKLLFILFWFHEFFSSTAPQVQSLKSTAPPPQLIQLRPTGANSGTPGVGQTMQIRPLRAAGGQTGPRPQFFKIVGGKPVQISGANLRQLPASALGK